MALIFAYKIREERGALPSWKHSLNDSSIWYLVNFIQSLGEQANNNASQQTHGHQHGHNHQHQNKHNSL